MKKPDPVAALTAASANESRKGDALQSAAFDYAEKGIGDAAAWAALTAAAKAWTNAYHQRSRCEKHVRER
jgi:hypothetical protein